MSKNIWVVANWKENKNMQEALDWVRAVGSRIENRPNIKVVVCPTFTAIEEVKKTILVGHYPLLVGAQDLSAYDEGAYTGEEAAAILRQFVDLAILGHSERRKNFNETDEIVAKKILQAIDHQIMPLVCVQDENTPIPGQVKLVAFEPIAAIGTGKPDLPTDAQAVAQKIKAKHPEVEVLYGGSVTSENTKAFIQQENINGVLVGEASLDAEEFVKIVDICFQL